MKFDKNKINTRLLEASINGDLVNVKLLLDCEADVNIKDHKEKTPLIMACKKGYLEIAVSLLEVGADVNAQDVNGSSPVMLASLFNFPKIVKLLIENGADVNAEDKENQNPLIMAVSRNHLDIVKLLLDRDTTSYYINRDNKQGCSPLIMASVKNHTETIKLLLENGGDKDSADKDGKTLLMYAAIFGNTEIVKILLKKDVKFYATDKNGKTALQIIKTKPCDKNREIIKLLLEAKKARQKRKNQIILFDAVRNNKINKVQAYITKGGDVNDANNNSGWGIFLLVTDIFCIHKKFLDDLVGHFGACFYPIETFKQTYLMHACHFRSLETVELLLSAGADVNANNPKNDGVTALMYALDGNMYALDKSNEPTRIIKLLIKAGADVNAKDNTGQTPLMYASYWNHTEAVKILIENGANVNDVVSIFDFLAIAKKLKAFKDISKSDDIKVTALMIARKKGYLEIVKLLKEHGAKQ